SRSQLSLMFRKLAFEAANDVVQRGGQRFLAGALALKPVDRGAGLRHLLLELRRLAARAAQRLLRRPDSAAGGRERLARGLGPGLQLFDLALHLGEAGLLLK